MNRVVAAGHVLLGVLGLLLLGYLHRTDAVMAGLLLLLIAVGGLALAVVPRWFERNRPGPELAPAPSGAVALAFCRAPYLIVMSALFCVAFGGWLVATAALLFGAGHGGWALPLLALALLILWPVRILAAGRIRPGGVWLTAAGIEYRNEALSWSLSWSDVLGVQPGEPVLLLLRDPEALAPSRTVRWFWDREARAPEGFVGIATAYLAGGGPMLAAVLQRCLVDPRFRERLGTPGSLPAGPAEPVSRRSAH